jgi:hypothetical protein
VGHAVGADVSDDTSTASAGDQARPVQLPRRLVVNDTDLEELGPIDYLVVEFPADRAPDGSALPLLLDLVDRGIIRVLDLAFARRELDGTVVGVEMADLDMTGDVDVSVFASASSGLLDDEDLTEAGSVLEPGCTAAVLVYENTWAAPFAAALRRNGAQLVANGRIPVQAVLASLDALDG